LILGRVTGPPREARIEVEVRGPGRRTVAVSAVLDTGFTGFLTLSEPIVRELALTFRGLEIGGLADGQQVRLRTYDAFVIWDGSELAVRAVLTGGAPLIGTRLFGRI
jgi:clan AA aspartic protease